MKKLQGRLNTKRNTPSENPTLTGDGAMTFSHLQHYRSDRPVPVIRLARAADTLIRDIGQRAAFEGIIPGHIKLLIKSGGAGMALSMTRSDTVDHSLFGGWDQLNTLTEYELTINVHLLVPVLLDEDWITKVLEPDRLVD